MNLSVRLDEESAPALWRPEVLEGRQRTRVLLDQLRTVDRGRLGVR